VSVAEKPGRWGRLYSLVIVALVFDIAFLFWLSGYGR
jgi:hypothetical protein